MKTIFSGASYHTCFHACLTLRLLSLNALPHIIHVHVECRLVNVPRCPLLILYLPPSVDCVLHTFLNITPKTPLNYFSSTQLSQKSVIRFALLAVDHVGRGVQSEFEPREGLGRARRHCCAERKAAHRLLLSSLRNWSLSPSEAAGAFVFFAAAADR